MDYEFNVLCNFDSFESLIWPERYRGYGDFEIYAPVNQETLKVIKTIQRDLEINLDSFAYLKGSESQMVIENIEITTDSESGNHVIISGRGLESLLERRIIWEKTILNGNIQNGVKTLINDSIINPKLSERKISNFKFLISDDEYINSLTINSQYTGTNLYEVIMDICNRFDLGFDVVLDSNNDFVFSLTHGEDRSYDQNKNNYVVFSPKYENIVNSDYIESSKEYKNVTLVAGEGEGVLRKKITVGRATGIMRRELYTDARDIQSESYDEYEDLESDKEKLNSYQEDLKELKESFIEVENTFLDDNDNYNKTMYEYNIEKKGYENRIKEFNKAIIYYDTKIEEYKKTLTSSQRDTLSMRNDYKEHVEEYDNVFIKECDDNINKYNNNLNEDPEITLEIILFLETLIEQSEAKKAELEEMRKFLDGRREEEEKKLPNVEELLDYEDKISNYKGIISNDQKSLDDITKTMDDEQKEYDKKKKEYEEEKKKYEAEVKNYEHNIENYEKKIAEDQNYLDHIVDKALEQRGEEKLSEYIHTKAFTGEIEALHTFVYGRDFFKGDIVQIINEYNMESKVTVSEVVIAQDSSGYRMYPTFQALE